MTAIYSPMRVALVDDHALFREGLRLLLTRNFPKPVEIVFEAENGARAVEMQLRYKASILLMDVQMPVLNGVVATEQICRQVPGAAVIGLSSSVDAGLVLEMVRAGAKGYLLKSVSSTELQFALEQVLAGETYFVAEVRGYLEKERASAAPDRTGLLSDREVTILRLICEGRTNRQVGEALFISKRTVDGHRERIMHKLGARNWKDLLTFAVQNGICTI